MNKKKFLVSNISSKVLSIVLFTSVILFVLEEPMKAKEFHGQRQNTLHKHIYKSLDKKIR